MYDTLIIGSGCAGLAAAIYARRFEMRTLVVGDLPGGTITKTHLVENYPGFTSLSGLQLGQNLLEHARAVEAELRQGSVTALEKVAGGFRATVGSETVEAKTVILATGTQHRHLGVPGEAEFTNKGVSYCATCDGPFFRGKDTAIVGGGDSAVKESLILSEHAARVYLIYRGSQLKAEPINLRRLAAKTNIEVILNANVTEILGEKVVTGARLDTGRELSLAGVFVEIGRVPKNELAKKLGCELAGNGEVITDRQSRTNVPGVFAAGDVTHTAWKQAITGAAEGAHAANSAFEFLQAA